LYLDDSGALTFGPPTGVQVYEAPKGFKIDTKKYQDAFKELSGLLPSSKEDVDKWVKYGVPRGVVTLLCKAAGFAAIVGTALAVYAWVIGVAIMIMGLLAEDDGLSPELAKVLYGIKGQLKGLEEKATADAMIQMHAELDGRVDLINGLLQRLSVEKPTGAARAAVFAQMRAVVDGLAVPLSRIRDQEWAVTYDPDDYRGRGFLAGSHLLAFTRSDGTAPTVPMQPATVNQFDYRLGVPMLLYAATTCVALAQAAEPWFRSSGAFVGQLRKTADAIDRFVLRMQDECLARTLYTGLHVVQQRTWPVTEVPGSVRPDLLPFEVYAVGAFDMVQYDDTFLSEWFTRQFQAGQDTGPRGHFNYRWVSPLGVNADPDAVAAAANERAALDYGRLQVTTGMMHLIHTAALLRFLSTPPDRSQTVAGAARDSRRLADTSLTTASSPWIFPGGVIESPATLKRYAAVNLVQVQTQEPGYSPSFRYRVVLRTLRSKTGEEGWHHLDYVGDVWRPEYEPTSADPRVKKLAPKFYGDWILSEVILCEEQHTPTEPVHRTGQLTISAPTFDWYVPVSSRAHGRLGGTARTEESRPVILQTDRSSGRLTGGVSVHLLDEHEAVVAGGDGTTPNRPTPDQVSRPTRTMDAHHPAAAFDDVMDIDVVAATEQVPQRAERRHVREEQVQLAWRLDWADGRLDVQLTGRAEDRPCQVHLVVEEIVYSGEVVPGDEPVSLTDAAATDRIHTSFTAEVVNQLMYVPEEFFDQERQALGNGAKLWRDFLTRYAEERPIRPGDPIESLDASQRELAATSSSTAALARVQNERAAFAQREAPEIWQAVLHREGIG
jgi:hypothetical protein